MTPGPEERANELVTAALAGYVGSARWFGGKGRSFQVGDVQRIGSLGPGEGGVQVGIEVVTIAYDDPSTGSGQGGATELYQVPLAYYPKAQERLEHAMVGQWEDPALGPVFAYDALHDRHATALWLAAFDSAHHDEDLVFHRLTGHDLDLDTHSSLYSGEQSNSSVAFGEDCLLKVFRKVTPGRNPDIEIHQALTLAENEHVAALFGWLEATASDGDDPVQLAMLQQFLRTASDGWDLALASVRDLFAEADLHADEVGGDFAGEAYRLGIATAEVHDALAQVCPTVTWGTEDLAALAKAMEGRLTSAIAVVPGLADQRDMLDQAFAAVAEIDQPVVAQRIHADFHLGQTLRTVRGWKIVDFEGEPAKPLAERVQPDSPWRDVAGMLRSFDYAAHAVEVDVEVDEDEEGAQIAYRAVEWIERNRSAYLHGYLEAKSNAADSGLSATQRTLLTAYEADKAVYETVYEARNRPDWLSIPLGAVERLALRISEEATRT